MKADLAGRSVLLLECDTFLAGYVGAALISAGARLVGPARDIVDARTIMSGVTGVDAAVIGITQGTTDEWAFSEELEARGIVVILTSAASVEITKQPRETPHLKKAFAAYQVVELVVEQLALKLIDDERAKSVADDGYS